MENMMIKEAAKRLGVEAHVLRYWEDELGLEIKRNSMGHRYYDERDIQLFDKVKELKENGLSLKDIKLAIIKQKRRQTSEGICKRDVEDANQESKEIHNINSLDKKGLQAVKTDSLNQTLSDNGDKETTSGEELSADIKIVDFKQAQLQAIMNKVVANALKENKEIITSSIKGEITADVMRQFDTVMREKEEKEEARFKKIDEYLRQLQQVNDEVAATRSHRLFGRRK